MYQLLDGAIKRISDNAIIPMDDANSDYRDYLDWLAAGNTPLPADPPTEAQIRADLERAVDKHIDAVAQADRWDNRITCSLRAAGNGPWKLRGVAFLDWMDACYVYCYQVIADVEAGLRQIPTEAELIAELPPMVWPE